MASEPSGFCVPLFFSVGCNFELSKRGQRNSSGGRSNMTQHPSVEETAIRTLPPSAANPIP